MEVFAPFYGSVSSSQAINIQSKRGKKLKTIFRKLKKKSKKKKKDLTENGLHVSVSRTSSYGSCSSSSSTDTSRTEETATSPFNASHEYATSYGKEDPAKRMSNETRKQDANSGEHERSDEWKKQSKSQKRKDGQIVQRPKRQRLGSRAQEETQRNRVGRIKGIWKKMRKPKKQNKISEAGNLQQLYVEYEEIKGVMTTNCEMLLKRNDKIEDLEDRGEKLVKQCEVFSRHAYQIKNEHASWWTRMRDKLGRLCCCFCFCCREEK